MTWWAVGAAVASAVVGAYSSYQQGQQQQAQLDAQAKANEYNAQVQAKQAEAARSQAASREDMLRQQARQVMGKQLAATAQSGVLLNGSASDLFRQSLYDTELDAMNVRYEGEMQATGLLNSSQLSQYEGRASRMAGKNAARSGTLSAVGSLVGGVGGAYTKYSKG